MKTRKLGVLNVSEIGMGCMGMSHAAGTPMNIDEAAEVIRAAVEMGYIFFDTAKNYGYKDDPHRNEKILGKALSGIRQQVVIASKCGVDFDYAVDPDVPPLLYDSSREGIRKSVEGSLKRLNTDYIDLYFQARPDPKVEPEEVAQTMQELIQEGKILHWGLSDFNFSGFNGPQNRDTDPNILLRFLKNLGRNVKATGPWFLLGIVLSVLFQRYVPAEAMTAIFGGNEALGVLMAATIGVPLYACGGGTIPLLQMWLADGMSMGSAAAFLLTGPSTKITNLGALKIVLGVKRDILMLKRHLYFYLNQVLDIYPAM